MTNKPLSRCVFGLLALSTALASAAEFSWKEDPGKSIELLHGDKPVAKYMMERMDPARREETYKVFHHVYAPDGKTLLTKGAGGRFTHHRGIFYGFKCTLTDAAGKTQIADIWHCKGCHQTHEKVLSSTADANHAAHTVQIAWRLDDGTVFATEERTLNFRKAGEGDGLYVDFTSKLSTTLPNLNLAGDPQHAGFHFRSADEVNDNGKTETYYIRPVSGVGEKGKTINWGKPEDDAKPEVTNVPWKALSMVVAGQRYSVLYLDSPNNPKPARYSEREYGRFGSYFVTDVTPEKPLTVKYRLYIQPGELTPEFCAAQSAEFTK